MWDVPSSCSTGFGAARAQAAKKAMTIVMKCIVASELGWYWTFVCLGCLSEGGFRVECWRSEKSWVPSASIYVDAVNPSKSFSWLLNAAVSRFELFLAPRTIALLLEHPRFVTSSPALGALPGQHPELLSCSWYELGAPESRFKLFLAPSNRFVTPAPTLHHVVAGTRSFAWPT